MKRNRAHKCERRFGLGLKRKLRGVGKACLLLILAATLTTGTLRPSYSQESDVIELTTEQADSLVRLIDGKDIDLWECRELARLDSVMYEEQLKRLRALQKAEEKGWLEKTVTSPVLWLLLGVYAGAYAAR